MKTSKMSLRQLVEGFELSCRAEGKSPRTIEWYVQFLRRFCSYFEKYRLPQAVDKVGKEDIRRFILHLQKEALNPRTGDHLSPATVQGYARTLKSFFSWLLREGYITSNPMNLISLPKAPFKIVQTFSTDDIRKILETCQASNGLWFRDMTLIVIMLDCGIRLSELVNLQIDDVNLTEGYLRIACGKGGKERVVPIGSVAQKMLWKYINHQRQHPITPKITTLFLSSRGFPISRSGVEQMLTRLGERAALSGVRCSPHTFRHSFAKNYLLNGADIFSLQKILGHTSLASVRNYVNLFAGDVKKQHQRFSPADNMAPDIKVLYSHLR